MSVAPDRMEDLVVQTRVTGIDYIYVHPDQITFDIYFIIEPGSLDDPLPDTAGNTNPIIDPGKVRIYQPDGAAKEIKPVSIKWRTSGGVNFLEINIDAPGDFVLYKVKVDDPRIDPFYNDVYFDFKANCPSDLDCKKSPHECAPEELVDFSVDYLSRDFRSFRQSLLDFASIRYPQWPDRLDADAGVMLTELMSAVADEMAYYQDRVGREAFLETATQRRSQRRHARLVDYPLKDGLASFAWVNAFVVTTGAASITGLINAGTKVFANSESGVRICFEIGKGLKEKYTGIGYRVDSLLNELDPYVWDEDNACLPYGSTEMFIDGHHENTPGPDDGQLVFDDFPAGGVPGKWVVLETRPLNPAQPARAHLVRLIKVTNETDPLYGKKITRISWAQSESTPYELDLSILKVLGNIVPASAGKTVEAYYFCKGENEPSLALLTDLQQIEGLQWAVKRKAANESQVYLLSLPGTTKQLISRIGNLPVYATPEVIVEEMRFTGASWVPAGVVWDYVPSLVGIHSADPEDNCYSLEDGTWSEQVTYRRPAIDIVHRDYVSGAGETVRFGDGEFGRVPTEETVFKVTYRLSNGKEDNVGVHSLTDIEATPGINLKVYNPIAAYNGLDREGRNEILQLAPEAFRAVTYRAVRPEDYAEAATRLPWVQKAGAVFRYTGSWLTAFVTPDPFGKAFLSDDDAVALEKHLDRFRQAGREVHVLDPEYADLDLEVEICAEPYAFPGEVKEQVLIALFGKKGDFPQPGYFSPDRFSFGAPLFRSTLESSIQSVPGVRAVEEILIRRGGWFDWQPFDTFYYDPGPNSIIRIENDRLHPDRGTIKIHIHGGS